MPLISRIFRYHGIAAGIKRWQMSFVQILNTFRAYGADVLLLALGVTLTVALLKKTVMKNVSGKAFVFLPFLIGFVYYAAFRCLVTLSADPFTAEIGRTLERGFACGCAATLYHAIYEQFLRGKRVSPLCPLLEGIVPEEKREEAAEALCAGCENMPEEALPDFLRDTLEKYAEPPMSREELAAFAKFLAGFLKTIKKK